MLHFIIMVHSITQQVNTCSKLTIKTKKNEICSELTKSPHELLRRWSFDFIVNFEQILQLVSASILSILSIFCAC